MNDPTPKQIPPTQLRKMVQNDIPQIINIEKQLFPQDHWSKTTFLNQLKLTNLCQYHVATINNQIVGYSGIAFHLDTADIQTLAVKNQWQNKKIGKQLLQNMLQQCYNQKITKILLEVRSDNPIAQKLYKNYGFTEIFRRKNYYKQATDAIIMQKTLNQTNHL